MRKHLNRRDFLKKSGGLTAGIALAGLPALSATAGTRDNELNILCWEGYNTDQVLDPFRRLHSSSKVRAESGTSDPDMINKLRAGESKVWDLINVNQPWARQQMYPQNLIKPINRERFEKYYDDMLPQFQGPYPLALDQSGTHLLGMVQRFGPFSFVVNTRKISRASAEDQGYQLFLDPAMKGRYGVLTYDNWNLIHICLAAGLDPFRALNPTQMNTFEKTAKQIFANAKLLTDDLVAMNTSLINGEIDAYLTGGTYTASPARLDGETQVRGITPKSGAAGGKGGVVWVELTSVVNNPDISSLAEDFLEYVQQPDVCKAVAFTEGTYNPVSQMHSSAVRSKFNKEELNAIQWDSLEEDLSRCAEYNIVTNYADLERVYSAAKAERA